MQQLIQSMYVQTNINSFRHIDLNETALAFLTVTLQIPNNTEIVQAVTEILLPTQWNMTLVSH